MFDLWDSIVLNAMLDEFSLDDERIIASGMRDIQQEVTVW